MPQNKVLQVFGGIDLLQARTRLRSCCRWGVRTVAIHSLRLPAAWSQMLVIHIHNTCQAVARAANCKWLAHSLRLLVKQCTQYSSQPQRCLEMAACVTPHCGFGPEWHVSELFGMGILNQMPGRLCKLFASMRNLYLSRPCKLICLKPPCSNSAAPWGQHQRLLHRAVSL